MNVYDEYERIKVKFMQPKTLQSQYCATLNILCFNPIQCQAHKPCHSDKYLVKWGIKKERKKGGGDFKTSLEIM